MNITIWRDVNKYLINDIARIKTVATKASLIGPNDSPGVIQNPKRKRKSVTRPKLKYRIVKMKIVPISKNGTLVNIVLKLLEQYKNRNSTAVINKAIMNVPIVPLINMAILALC